jgi:hypothetical protein
MPDDLQNEYMIKRLRIAIERAEAAEVKLEKAVDFCRRLDRFAQGTNDQFLLDRCGEILKELTDARPD